MVQGMGKARHGVGPVRKLLAAFPVAVVIGARSVEKTTPLRHEIPGWQSVVLDPEQDTAGSPDGPRRGWLMGCSTAVTSG